MALLLWIYWLSPLDEVAPVSEWCGSIFTGQGGSATPEYSTQHIYPRNKREFKPRGKYQKNQTALTTSELDIIEDDPIFSD